MRISDWSSDVCSSDLLDMPAGRIVDDVAQIFEIAFEHVERAAPVQRLHGVISVANPAEAVIPVAPPIGIFGDRRGARGDDRAGLLDQKSVVSGSWVAVRVSLGGSSIIKKKKTH